MKCWRIQSKLSCLALVSLQLSSFVDRLLPQESMCDLVLVQLVLTRRCVCVDDAGSDNKFVKNHIVNRVCCEAFLASSLLA